MKICVKKAKFIASLLTPLIFSPLAASPFEEAKCAYIVIWMSIFWVLEPVHLAVTSLLPVVLLPLLGILSAQEVCANYMKEVLMMFFGGLAVAVAVEHCNLHERIALKVLLLLGSDTKWLMLGFMMTTMSLSMWISNTATTAMMVPIINALMMELKVGLNDESSDNASHMKTDALHRTLLLSVAYSANCGGTGTVTGTSPNMIFKGYVESFYPESSEITFASWMAYNIPGMLLCVLSCWIILQLLYVPCWRKQSEESKSRIRNVIASRYRELGSITFHESAVLCLFAILLLLWTFREPKFMTGWAELISSDSQIGTAVPAIGILFLLFFLPAEPWRAHKSPPLLPWSAVQEKMPWGLVILLGGGFALANGTEKSGLSKWIGDQMSQLSFLSPGVVLVILCICTAALTEIISNNAVATILLPVVNQMAVAFKVNPLYLMLPVAVASSYAFMLPVATAPNAIIFDTGYLKTIEMVKPGIIMNFVCCGIQLLMINTLGVYLFNLNTFPAWMNHDQLSNVTHTSAINSSDVS